MASSANTPTCCISVDISNMSSVRRSLRMSLKEATIVTNKSKKTKPDITVPTLRTKAWENQHYLNEDLRPAWRALVWRPLMYNAFLTIVCKALLGHVMLEIRRSRSDGTRVQHM